MECENKKENLSWALFKYCAAKLVQAELKAMLAWFFDEAQPNLSNRGVQGLS